MNKVLLASFALSMLALSSVACADEYNAPAHHSSTSPVRFYIGAQAGASFMDVSADCYNYDHYYYDYYADKCNLDSQTAFTVNPHVGIDVRFDPVIGARFELEGFYHSKTDYSYDVWNSEGRLSRDKFELETAGGFFNSYLDIHTNSPFTPYVGFGLGFASHDTKLNFGKNDSTTNFAYNVGLGTAINLNKNFAFDIGLRYANYGEVLKDAYFEKVEVSSVDLLGGVRITF